MRALETLELRDRADVHHLVDRWRQRDHRTGHLRDARAPDAAAHHDRVRPDVAAGRADPGNPAARHLDAGDLRGRCHGQRAQRHRLLAHQGAAVDGVHDAHRGRVEPAQQLGIVDPRHQVPDLAWREHLDVDAVGVGRAEPAAELDHPGLRAGDLDPAAPREHAEVGELPDPVHAPLGHLPGVLHGEGEARGVAGGSAGIGQRALVDLDDVAPAQPGQVPHQCVAGDAGSDDDDACLGRHTGHGDTPSLQRCQ